MEIFQLMVFVIPVFSALSSSVFLLAGQRDVVYENTGGGPRPKPEQKRKTVNK